MARGGCGQALKSNKTITVTQTKNSLQEKEKEKRKIKKKKTAHDSQVGPFPDPPDRPPRSAGRKRSK
jgi:hypothetical protein